MLRYVKIEGYHNHGELLPFSKIFVWFNEENAIYIRLLDDGEVWVWVGKVYKGEYKYTNLPDVEYDDVELKYRVLDITRIVDFRDIFKDHPLEKVTKKYHRVEDFAKSTFIS